MCKTNFNVKINGIDVQATYTKENIEQIFIPLLERLTAIKNEKEKRILVMLAAPPGTGKSTLCEFLKDLSEKTPKTAPVQIIGMDGFHRYQEYLTTHTAIRDGKEIPMVKIKGAPVTFDLEKLTERVKMVATGENTGWPVYNRMTHNPQEDALSVTGDIVILEGNYLLLEEDGWNELRKYADYTIRILASEEDLEKRLIDRKIKSGTSKEEAEAFVAFSDLYNARLCLNKTMPADLNLRLNHDDSYCMEAAVSLALKANEQPSYRKYSSEPDVPDCGCIYG